MSSIPREKTLCHGVPAWKAGPHVVFQSQNRIATVPKYRNYEGVGENSHLGLGNYEQCLPVEPQSRLMML